MRELAKLALFLFQALDVLLNTRNVTRAAAPMRLTQPAISGMLVRLRHAPAPQPGTCRPGGFCTALSRAR